MDIKDIKGSAGTTVTLSATVDGVRCDVSLEDGALALRPTAWDRAHEVLARGDEVPEVLRAEYARLQADVAANGAEWLKDAPKCEPIAALPEPHFLGQDKTEK